MLSYFKDILSKISKEGKEEEENCAASLMMMVDKDGEISFDYIFHEDYVEYFVTLFVGLNVGSFATNLYEMIVRQLSDKDPKVAANFIKLCNDKMKEIQQDNEEDEEDDYAIDPLRVFNENSNKGEYQ